MSVGQRTEGPTVSVWRFRPLLALIAGGTLVGGIIGWVTAGGCE